MKHLLYSAILILLAVAVSFSLPILIDSAENFLTDWQIPANSSEVAGIQKYSVPPTAFGFPPPQLSARGVYVLDLATNTKLFEKNADSRLPIASTTKIMTALLANSYFKQNAILTVGDGASVVGSKVGLFRGETLSFRALLYGLLLNSGNDAAFTIAENYPGGTTGFVEAMNQKASLMGLNNTHFENPAGLDHPNHFSSAKDLSQITREALNSAQLARIFATKDTQIVSLDKKHTYELHNLNKLLTSVAGVLGVKTGYTISAKENLVTLVDRGGHRVLLVVLGSDDRFGESIRLIDWTYSNFIWQN